MKLKNLDILPDISWRYVVIGAGESGFNAELVTPKFRNYIELYTHKTLSFYISTDLGYTKNKFTNVDFYHLDYELSNIDYEVLNDILKNYKG